MNKFPENIISIIMPCFQQVEFLEQAVRSVLDQQGVDVELLVFDPGSTDGSRELLQDLQKRYGDNLRLFFEEDHGQTDAINKGLGRARGNTLGWLNSDDCLRDDALRLVAEYLPQDQPAWLYGQSGMINAKGEKISGFIVKYKNLRGKNFSPFKLLTENFIPQMSTFWNRRIGEIAGPLATEKHLDMDYDLWLRFSAIVCPIVVDRELSNFRVHSRAKGSKETNAQLKAAYRTAREHSASLGHLGKLALCVHWVLGLRTRLVYWFIKP